MLEDELGQFSDLEVELDSQNWQHTVGREAAAHLAQREIDRQEVINGEGGETGARRRWRGPLGGERGPGSSEKPWGGLSLWVRDGGQPVPDSLPDLAGPPKGSLGSLPAAHGAQLDLTGSGSMLPPSQSCS